MRYSLAHLISLVLDSTTKGIDYTYLGMPSTTPLGCGTGSRSLNHLHSIVPRVIPLYAV